MISRSFTSPPLENRVVVQTNKYGLHNKGSSQESSFDRIVEKHFHWITLDIVKAQSPFSRLERWSRWTETGLMSSEGVKLLMDTNIISCMF